MLAIFGGEGGIAQHQALDADLRLGQGALGARIQGHAPTNSARQRGQDTPRTLDCDHGVGVQTAVTGIGSTCSASRGRVGALQEAQSLVGAREHDWQRCVLRNQAQLQAGRARIERH